MQPGFKKAKAVPGFTRGWLLGLGMLEIAWIWLLKFVLITQPPASPKIHPLVLSGLGSRQQHSPWQAWQCLHPGRP